MRVFSSIRDYLGSAGSYRMFFPTVVCILVIWFSGSDIKTVCLRRKRAWRRLRTAYATRYDRVHHYGCRYALRCSTRTALPAAPAAHTFRFVHLTLDETCDRYSIPSTHCCLPPGSFFTTAVEGLCPATATTNGGKVND